MATLVAILESQFHLTFNGGHSSFYDNLGHTGGDSCVAVSHAADADADAAVQPLSSRGC